MIIYVVMEHEPYEADTPVSAWRTMQEARLDEAERKRKNVASRQRRLYYTVVPMRLSGKANR